MTILQQKSRQRKSLPASHRMQLPAEPLPTSPNQIFDNEFRAQHMGHLLLNALRSERFTVPCAGCGNHVNIPFNSLKVRTYWHSGKPMHAYAICEKCLGAAKTHEDFERLEAAIHASQGPKVVR